MPLPENTIKITGLNAGTVKGGSLLATSEPDSSTPPVYNSSKVSAADIADFVANNKNYAELLTIAKTLIGAINEIAQGGGGGDSVSWSQVVVSGTKIATITINNIPTDVYAPEGGGTANFVELTQAEYDALEQAGELEPDVMYFITDGQSGGGVVIDDSTTAADKVWSSDKVSDELDTKQEDLEGGGLSDGNLNNYITNGNYWVTRTNMTNVPVDSFGYLEVIRVNTTTTSFICMQRFTRFAADSSAQRGEIYLRFYSNSQWYNWFKVAQLIT